MPGDEDDRTNYEDMLPLSYEGFQQALDEGKACTFFVDDLFELKVARAFCVEKKLPFQPHFFKSPTVPSGLTVYLSGRDNKAREGANAREEALAGARNPREKKTIKVKVVPKQHEQLHNSCDYF